MNISRHNYESWFLLYADGELTPDEQTHVDQFLLQHPSLQEEFDQVMQLRLDNSDSIEFEEKELLKPGVLEELERVYRFEPDYAIQFPEKQLLYKRTPIKRMLLYRVTAAAAVLIGLMMFMQPFWTGESAPAIVVSTPDIDSPLIIASVQNKDIRETRIVAPAPQLRTSSTSHLTEDASPVRVEEPEAGATAAEVSSQSIETGILTAPSAPRTNFSEEALQAAEQRMAQQAVAVPAVHHDAPNTELLLRTELENKEKGRIRGLFRTVGRSLFGEHSETDERRYIQVASFKFPVKH